MTHELKDLLMGCSAIVGTIAAIAVPALMYFTMKTSWAETWGQFKQLVTGHGERLDKLETTVEQHTSDIGYLKGKTNSGAAAHASR